MPTLLTYFNNSGECIGKGSFDYEYRLTDHAVSKVRGWRDNGGQGALPGLGDHIQTDKIIILIQPKSLPPRLLFPRK